MALVKEVEIEVEAVEGMAVEERNRSSETGSEKGSGGAAWVVSRGIKEKNRQVKPRALGNIHLLAHH